MSIAAFDVPGLEFYDGATQIQMKYVYPDTPHWTAGWILYKNPGDGQWVTLRKATEADLKALQHNHRAQALTLEGI